MTKTLNETYQVYRKDIASWSNHGPMLIETLFEPWKKVLDYNDLNEINTYLQENILSKEGVNLINPTNEDNQRFTFKRGSKLEKVQVGFPCSIMVVDYTKIKIKPILKLEKNLKGGKQ